MCRSTLFFISFLFILYVFVDLSIHLKLFTRLQNPLKEVAQYYLWHLAKRGPILLPFALMIAVIKTLCHMNTYHELIALYAAGISTQRIYRVFWMVALICSGLILIDTQFLLPRAGLYISQFENQHFSSQEKNHLKKALYHIELEDGSFILFRELDIHKKNLNDVYWIISPDKIMKAQSITLSHPTEGNFVDFLERKEMGFLLKSESYTALPLPQLHIHLDKLQQSTAPIQEQSLSLIWQQLQMFKHNHSNHLSVYQTWLHYRIAEPLICLIVILAPIPFCLKATRNLKVFFIYAIAIAGFMAFFMIIHACIVLGENRVFPPIACIWIPILSFLTWGWFQYRQA